MIITADPAPPQGFRCISRTVSLYLDVEQPGLQTGHSLLPHGQVPHHHIQGLVSEEALIDSGHAGLPPHVPHVEGHHVFLCVRAQTSVSVLLLKP